MPSFVTSSNSTYAARTAAGVNTLVPASTQPGDIEILVITSDKAIDIAPGFVRLTPIKTLSTGQFVDVQISTVAEGEPGFGGVQITCGQDTTGVGVTWNGSWALGFYRNAKEPTVASWGTAVTTTSVVAPAATAAKPTAMLVECLGAATSNNTATALTVSSPVTSRVSQSIAGRPSSKVAFGDQQLAAAGSTGTRTTTLTAAQTLGAAGLILILEPLDRVIPIGRASGTNRGRPIIPPVTNYPSLIQQTLPTFWYQMNGPDSYNSGTDPQPGEFTNNGTSTVTYVPGLTAGSGLASRAAPNQSAGWWAPSPANSNIAQPIVYEGLFRTTELIAEDSNVQLAGLDICRIDLTAGQLSVQYRDASDTNVQVIIPGVVGTGDTRMVTATFTGAATGTTGTLKLYLDGVLVGTYAALAASYPTRPQLNAMSVGGQVSTTAIDLDEQQVYLNPSMANWTDVKIAARWAWAKPPLVRSNRSLSIRRPPAYKEYDSASTIQPLTAFKINRALSIDRGRTIRRPGAGPQAMEINTAKETSSSRVIVTPIQNYVDYLSRKPPTFWFGLDSNVSFNKGTSALPGTFVAGQSVSFVSGITPGSTKATSSLRNGGWRVTSPGVDITQPIVYEGLFSFTGAITAQDSGPQIGAIPGIATVFLGTGATLRASYSDNLGGRNLALGPGTADGNTHMLTIVSPGGVAVGGFTTVSFYLDGALVGTISNVQVMAAITQLDFGNASSSASKFITVDEHSLYANANLAVDHTAAKIAERWSYAKPPPPAQAVSFGRALEASTVSGLGLGLAVRRAVGATTARTLGLIASIRRATETDAARTVVPQAQAAARSFGIGRAAEVDAGRTVRGDVTRAISRAAATSVGRILGRGLTLRRAGETDTSRTVTPRPGPISTPVQRVAELDTVEEIAPRGSRQVQLQQAVQVTSSRTITPTAGIVRGPDQAVSVLAALEQDAAEQLRVRLAMTGRRQTVERRAFT